MYLGGRYKLVCYGEMEGFEKGRQVRDEKNLKDGGRILKEIKEKIKVNFKQFFL